MDTPVRRFGPAFVGSAARVVGRMATCYRGGARRPHHIDAARRGTARRATLLAAPVVANLVEQRAVREIEQLRGARAIAACSLERFLDERPLELFGAALHRQVER